jgi:hypothetical protein
MRLAGVQRDAGRDAGLHRGHSGLPPTSRTEDTRVWGPITPKEQPDFEFRVVVVRASVELFQYAIQVRRKTGTADWFSALQGQFECIEPGTLETP